MTTSLNKNYHEKKGKEKGMMATRTHNPVDFDYAVFYKYGSFISSILE